MDGKEHAVKTTDCTQSKNGTTFYNEQPFGVEAVIFFGRGPKCAERL